LGSSRGNKYVPFCQEMRGNWTILPERNFQNKRFQWIGRGIIRPILILKTADEPHLIFQHSLQRVQRPSKRAFALPPWLAPARYRWQDLLWTRLDQIAEPARDLEFCLLDFITCVLLYQLDDAFPGDVFGTAKDVPSVIVWRWSSH
jgi:hypothetical protein